MSGWLRRLWRHIRGPSDFELMTQRPLPDIEIRVAIAQHEQAFATHATFSAPAGGPSRRRGSVCRREPDGHGWQSMDTAPRDGTVVELVCTYGVMPWYGLFRWSDTVMGHDGNSGGVVPLKLSKPTWAGANGETGSVDDEDFLQWRPAPNSGAPYVDPTKGAQTSREYWL